MWTVRQIHLLFHSTDIQQTARNAAAGPHHEASFIRQRFHKADHRGLRKPKATSRRALYRRREPHSEFGIEPLPDDPDVRQIELPRCLRQECRLPFTRFDESHRPFGMKRRKHQARKPGAAADIEKPGLTVAFSHRGSPVHPGRDRLRVVATNPLRRLRFTDQPDHPVPAFQEFRMTRQPINRFRRQLGAELSLKQITVFHVKHLRVSGAGVSRETIAADRSHRTSPSRLSLAREVAGLSAIAAKRRKPKKTAAGQSRRRSSWPPAAAAGRKTRAPRAPLSTWREAVLQSQLPKDDLRPPTRQLTSSSQSRRPEGRGPQRAGAKRLP